MKRRKRMTPSTTPLARRTPMKCGKPLVNQAPLKRTGPVKAVNRKRKREKYARNFGAEADAVRGMPCLAGVSFGRLRPTIGGLHGLRCCCGDVVAAHVTARGMGAAKGCNVDQVPLCDAHHREAGEARTSQRAAFESLYGLDMRKVADDIAVGHPRPLGIRGLADRWAWWQQAMAAVLDSTIDSSSLSDHETDALMGWVRREADLETERRYRLCRNCFGDGRDGEPSMGGRDPGCIGPCEYCGGSGYTSDRRALEWFDDHGLTPPDDPDALADHIATRLGGIFADGDRSLARALLDAAVQR